MRRLVQERRGDLGAHPLAERELPNRLVEQALELQKADELVAGRTVAGGLDPIDGGEEVEALDHRQVPPELRALAEHHADARHVADAILVGDEAVDHHLARRRPEDAGEDLDGGRFPRPVRADEAQQLAGLEREADPVERFDGAHAAMEQTLERAKGAGVALGDAVALGQLANEDLRHGRGLRGLGKGRAGGRGPYRRHICRATADAGQRAGTFSGVAKLQPTAIAAT